jgi:hypothetical protein
MDERVSNRAHDCPARDTEQYTHACGAFLVATFASLSCLPACSDDGVPIPPTPTSYRLTFAGTDQSKPPRTVSATIDWTNNLFVAGMNGKDASLTLVRDGNTWHLPSGVQPTFPFTLQQPVFADLAPVLDDLWINELSLRPTDGGCAGSVSGGLSSNYGGGDVVVSYELGPGFDCVVDHVGPAFGAGRGPLNPVDLRYIGADEYVGPPVTAGLVDSTGNTIALAPTGSAESPYGTSRLSVAAVLAFGSAYTLVASGTDLAGNTGTSFTQIATGPDPGLFSQDGFEGPINAAMSSLVKVVEAPAMPIPTGKKALAITKTWSGMAYARFTARLQAPPGATAVKVTYVRFRVAAPDATSDESHIIWTVGVPNTTAVAVYDKDQPPVTAEARPWTSDPTAQGASGWYSQPQTLSFPLPAPATWGEVLFDVLSDQFTTSFEADGAFLLDDLRVE